MVSEIYLINAFTCIKLMEEWPLKKMKRVWELMQSWEKEPHE